MRNRPTASFIFISPVFLFISLLRGKFQSWYAQNTSNRFQKRDFYKWRAYMWKEQIQMVQSENSFWLSRLCRENSTEMGVGRDKESIQGGKWLKKWGENKWQYRCSEITIKLKTLKRIIRFFPQRTCSSRFFIKFWRSVEVVGHTPRRIWATQQATHKSICLNLLFAFTSYLV